MLKPDDNNEFNFLEIFRVEVRDFLKLIPKVEKAILINGI